MGLSEKEKFNLIKPLPEGWPKDDKGTPYLKRDVLLETINWNETKFASYSNVKSTSNKENKILLNFQYDKTINCIYNDIFSYARKVFDFLAVTTPDYSAYTNMEPWVVEENVRHNLWVGAWLQYLGIKVIPTVTWADERTYDICFNFIEKGSIVAISTVGIIRNKELFLKGFNEMIKRIKPSLILVRGKPIEGMSGKFIFIDFCETFEIALEYEQLALFQLDKIQILGKEED